ncbi:MAG: ABC transporter permease [Motilibacteraceae bacterium]
MSTSGVTSPAAPAAGAATGVAHPARVPARPWLAAYLHWLEQYKRTWRGSALTTLLIPLGTLLALGYGLGTLVDGGGGLPGVSVSYAAFLAPGLLATAVMQNSCDDSMWPVMGAIKWNRTYLAMLATPLGSRDVWAGHALWILTRATVAATVFLGFSALLGLVSSWWALAVPPVAVLLAASFALPVMAFSARAENDENFSLLYRFAIIPLSLFSGAYFQVSQLPAWIQPVAWATPLWHGVQLTRGAMLGAASGLGVGMAVLHLAVIAVWVVVGARLVDASFRRRLVR